MSTDKSLQRLKKHMSRTNKKRKELGEDVYSSMYDSMYDEEFLRDHLDNHVKYVLKKDLQELGDMGHFIMSMYSPKQSLAGSTDYKDHRNDTIDQLKDKLYSRIDNYCMGHQRGHLYNDKNQIFDTVVLVGRKGGWSAEMHWSDGSVSFFEWQRQN